jgi:hypothetical protein
MLLCICLLATLLGHALATPIASGPRGSDKLYGIVVGFAGQYTETVVQTVDIDLNSGTMTPFLTNFIYAGSSLTYDGISTLDTTNKILHYSTDSASAFIWGVDLQYKQIAPPIDVGATDILDLKYDYNSSNLYFVFEDYNNAVLYGAYSTGNGPAELIANFTLFLEATGSELGQGALGDTPTGLFSDYYFVSYSASSFNLNTYNATTGNLTGVPLARECTGANDKYFDYLSYDPTTKKVFGIQETVKNNRLHYFFSVVDPVTGQCNSTAITGTDGGIITCWTFSPSTNNFYFGMATNGGSEVCYTTMTNFSLSAPVCVTTNNILADIEVDWLGN